MITSNEKYKHKVTIRSVPSLGNRHQHWAKTARERKMWHQRIQFAFKYRPLFPLKAVSIYVVRYSSRMPDYDNLVYSFKPIFDGLIHAGIIVNDDMNTVVMRHYSWAKVKRGQEQITIDVEEI